LGNIGENLANKGNGVYQQNMRFNIIILLIKASKKLHYMIFTFSFSNQQNYPISALRSHPQTRSGLYLSSSSQMILNLVKQSVIVRSHCFTKETSIYKF